MMARRDQGFTLIEIVLVIMLIGILSAIIVVPVMSGARAWRDMTRQNEVAQQARIGLERFVRELRAVVHLNGRPSIVQADANTIHFFAVTGQQVEELKYSWPGAGQPLKRAVLVNGLQVSEDDVARMIQNFDLLYYENSNALITPFRQEAENAPADCTPGACNIFNGDVLLSNVGETVFYDFTGTNIVWIGPKGNNLGMADVTIDTNPPGGLPGGGALIFLDLDQYASVNISGQPLFRLADPLPYDDYTITIVYTGNQNPLSAANTVAVDAFDLLISRVVVNVSVGDGDYITRLRDQVSFRRVE